MVSRIHIILTIMSGELGVPVLAGAYIYFSRGCMNYMPFPDSKVNFLHIGARNTFMHAHVSVRRAGFYGTCQIF